MKNRIKMISAVSIAGGLLWALSAQQASPISGQWIIDRIDVPGQVLLTLGEHKALWAYRGKLAPEAASR